MKKWIVFFILTICTYLIEAKNTDSDDEAKKDLLMKLSRLDQNDTIRLDIYYKLMNISKDPNVKTYYSEKVLSEAKRLNNARYQCRVYLRRINNAYNQYAVEEVTQWMNLLEPIARKAKLYDYLFLGRRCVIDMMMVKGEYEREIKEAQNMLQEAQELQNNLGIIAAYQCLANVYRTTYRIEEAAQVLEKAYKIAYSTDTSFTIEINNSLIGTYESLKDYRNWLKWIQTLDKYLQKKIKEKPNNESSWRSRRLMVAISYINYYTTIGDLQNAANNIQQAKMYNMDSYNIYCYYHHMARYNYFNKAQLYEEALKETTILADIYKELTPLTYSTMIFMKAQTLEKLDRYDESLSAYRQAFSISDSINIAYLNKQTEQLKDDYNTEQLQLEKEKISRNIQLLYIGLILITILILAIFVIHTFRVRKGLKKSEEEMRKMTEEMKLANIAKEHFLSTISTSISIPLNKVVNGALKLTTDEVTEENERKDISQSLNKTSAELMTLINNILNLSRLEAGMMKFRIEEVEIIPFLQGLIRMEVSEGRTINAEILNTETNLKILADISWLQILFKNMFVASDENGVQLKMKISENKKELNFCISNSILSTNKEQSRDITMTNEINRLTVENFKGRYTMDTDTHAIRFYFPLT